MAEWVVFAERTSGYHSIVRSGFATAREAAIAMEEMERRMEVDDSTNLLVLSREKATERWSN